MAMTDNDLPQRKLGVRDIGYWRVGLCVALVIGLWAFVTYRQRTQEQQEAAAKQEIATKQEIVKTVGMTSSQFNGRAWKEFGNDAKVSWVVGFDEGIFDGVSRSARPKSEDELNRLCGPLMIPKGFPYATLASEIDKLYENAANLPIPIPWAFDWTIAKIKNAASDDELQRHLATLRQRANELVLEDGK
jgi:hypothetical protein